MDGAGDDSAAMMLAKGDTVVKHPGLDVRMAGYAGANPPYGPLEGIRSFTIYRRSRNPRPAKIAGIAFSIRAVRVADCLAPVK